MTDIALLSATDLVGRYERGELSPVEVTQAVLERIDRYEPVVNAYCLVDADAALADAKRSQERWQAGEPAGRVDGIPVAVKDVFLTRGWPTLKGSKLIDPAGPWEQDAPVVSALRRHGAVLVGKTTTPEIGWKAVTDSPLCGITRNPWDPTRTSGGSSGGTAAAVSLGMGTLGLGTDGGGSIRIPASFCGHVGLKPTWGRVPVWPVSPFGTLAHAGPHAWTVADAALMLSVIAEPDPRDWTALAPEGFGTPEDGFSERGASGARRTGLGRPPDYTRALRTDASDVRIAFSPTLGYVDVDPEVAACVTRAAGVFEELGAHVSEVDPGFDDPLESFVVLWSARAAQAMRAHDNAPDRALMDPGLVELLDLGVRYSVLDYLEAVARKGELGVGMSCFLTDHDLLLTPTMPSVAFEAGRDVPEGWPHDGWPTWTPFSYPFNLAQQPAISVPCGFSSGGLPIGLQIVGAKYRDALVLRAAHAYQTARPLTDRRPDPTLKPQGGTST